MLVWLVVEKAKRKLGDIGEPWVEDKGFKKVSIGTTILDLASFNSRKGELEILLLLLAWKFAAGY